MKTLLLIPLSPFIGNSGHKLALMSDIKAFRSAGIDLKAVIYTIPFEKEHLDPYKMIISSIPAKSGGRILRFLRSLVGLWPAAIERHYSSKAKHCLSEAITEFNPEIIIIEDVILGGWIDHLKKITPNAKIILRSHNFMAKVAKQELENSPWLLKPLFVLEKLRWTRLEKKTVEKSDKTWAITQLETEEMSEFYNVKNIEYFPISVDISRYEKVLTESGSSDVFLHLGSLDLKKLNGIMWFLKTIWPIFLKFNSNSRLILGGAVNTLKKTRDKQVELISPVTSDVDFYRTGRFSINPQKIGGGVKLKSLVSMACGRVLLSTNNGVEGLSIQNGVHYWNLEELLAKNKLYQIFENPDLNIQISINARRWVNENHSEDKIKKTLLRLIKNLNHEN